MYYYKLAGSKHCSKKEDTTREEIIEMLVYGTINAESDDGEVSVK
jgi:hypothetical protein